MPARFSAFKRAIETLGGTVIEPNSGSHWKVRINGRMYPIPAHNGLRTELSDRWIDGACRSLGIDKETLRALL